MNVTKCALLLFKAFCIFVIMWSNTVVKGWQSPSVINLKYAYSAKKNSALFYIHSLHVFQELVVIVLKIKRMRSLNSPVNVFFCLWNLYVSILKYYKLTYSRVILIRESHQSRIQLVIYTRKGVAIKC